MGGSLTGIPEGDAGSGGAGSPFGGTGAPLRGAGTVPDWLASVPRARIDSSGWLCEGGIYDAEIVRLADVVAAAQEAEQRWREAVTHATHFRERADAAEAEREATIEHARKTCEFHREMALRFEEGRHDLKQRVRTLEALRAAVERAVAAFRAWDQTPDGMLDVETLDSLHALGTVFDAGANGKPDVSHSPDLTALRAAVATLDGILARDPYRYAPAVEAVLNAARVICEKEQP